MPTDQLHKTRHTTFVANLDRALTLISGYSVGSERIFTRENGRYQKKRTLTNLYNERPTWLDLAHRKLDKVVLAAYGWSDLMDDEGNVDEEEVLSRLLALNLERAEQQ